NIVQVYDAKQDGNVHYFTMRLVDGLPLSHLTKGKGLPPRRALEIARKVALALDYAHARGVIHRDVKPANILIDSAGEPHVADFGLAKDLSPLPPGSSEAGLTVQGSALGTPSYASPEQVGADSARIDARTDVYGLGATLYEMLTGRPPFVGDSVFTIVADVLGREPDPPRAVNANLHRDIETICLKAMEKDPARRYATAADLAEDVRRYLEGEPIFARPVSGPERLWRKAARHRAVVIPSVAAVLIAAGWWGWWAWSASEREEASRRVAHAEEALGKAERVSRVLARWSRLAEDLRRLEAAAYDGSLSADERRKRTEEPLLRVAAFVAETPADSSSQSAASALAGWARWLSGDEPGGLAEMRRAASIDPDVPFASLYEGLARLTRLVESLTLPRVEGTPSGGRAVAPPPETAEQGKERENVVRLLDRARAASVWGKEGAEGLGAAIDALSAMRDGDWARAEAGLSRALETPDLRMAESGLLLARARVRYLRGEFDAAQEDLAHVLRARPESAEAYKALAEVKLGQVARLSVTGGDLGTQLRVAIDALGQTLQRAPQDAHAFKIRAYAYRTLGIEESLRGKDPRPTWKLALDDLDEAIRLARGNADALGDRGVLRQKLAEWMAAHGLDSAETLALGEKDLSKAIEFDPANVSVLVNRGSILLERAEREAAGGADPLPTLEKALADLSKAIQLNPRESRALNNRGLVHYRVGLRAVSRGADPLDSFRKALAEFDASLAVEPGFVFALNNRGLVGRDLGEWQAAHGADPREAWDAAVAALDAAIARSPDYPLAYQNRGDVHWKRGEWEMGRGEDAGEWFLRAEGDYGRVLALNPEHHGAFNSRASGRWRMAEWEMRSGKDPTPR
ncbi:MAG: protein kinase, partial [Planctomycetota bacterium]